MTPYVLSQEDINIIKSVLTDKTKSSQEKWKDDNVKTLKSKIKTHYIDEQDHKCAYCLVHNPSDNHKVWDTEHIIDKSSSPQWMFEPLNLCVSCPDCNSAKGIRAVAKSKKYTHFPKQSRNYKIIHPHFDTYEDHIDCALPGFTYRWKTEKGRYTIETCGLLRYHSAVGRKNTDLILKSLLALALKDPSPEVLNAVSDHIINSRTNQK
ncbi:hypothetical protein LDJ79_05855 [Vibrio tritonius]|uniref:HNH endonuclease n=1 Tax=Vibrio tritonius TaxID=1435069 RepID=A0ABS7YIX4_9VIBR|nr:hypothetical protein [Vibrio tritonius]MCA2015626.1 hypothetical protein [Vibrio tritonius]